APSTSPSPSISRPRVRAPSAGSISRKPSPTTACWPWARAYRFSSAASKPDARTRSGATSPPSAAPWWAIASTATFPSTARHARTSAFLASSSTPVRSPCRTRSAASRCASRRPFPTTSSRCCGGPASPGPPESPELHGRGRVLSDRWRCNSLARMAGGTNGTEGRGAPELASERRPSLLVRWWRGGWWRRLLLVGLALFVVGLLAGGGTFLWLLQKYGKEVPDAPDLDKWRPPILSEVYSTDEILLAEFFRERRKIVPYERIPKKLVQAFIAAEDEKFFDHHGFDVFGIASAAFKNLRAGRIRGGGSTITQQTAKALLIEAEGYEKGTEKTIRRKLKELVLALKLEKKLSKEEILWLYLNHVYLGHHSYGVQSAAENYFRKNVWELTLPEMALLAGLPQAPSRYSPFARPEAAAARREYVLRRMYEEGMITAHEREEASKTPVRVHGVEPVFKDTAPFYAEHIRRDIVARYGNDRLLEDGLKVWSTMNHEAQRYAQEA